MADILLAGPAIPTTADTPLDKRTRHETIAAFEVVENPYVGMIAYVKETQRHYRVLSLKSTKVGALTIWKIDAYEAMPCMADIPDVTAALDAADAAFDTADVALETADAALAAADEAKTLAGAIKIAAVDEIIFAVDGLSEESRASLIVELCGDASFGEGKVRTLDSALEEDNQYFRAWGGFTLGAYPPGGVNGVYNGGHAVFTIPADCACEYYRWHWRSEAGDTQGSATSMCYGRLHAIRQGADFSKLGF